MGDQRESGGAQYQAATQYAGRSTFRTAEVGRDPTTKPSPAGMPHSPALTLMLLGACAQQTPLLNQPLAWTPTKQLDLGSRKPSKAHLRRYGSGC